MCDKPKVASFGRPGRAIEKSPCSVLYMTPRYIARDGYKWSFERQAAVAAPQAAQCLLDNLRGWHECCTAMKICGNWAFRSAEFQGDRSHVLTQYVVTVGLRTDWCSPDRREPGLLTSCLPANSAEMAPGRPRLQLVALSDVHWQSRPHLQHPSSTPDSFHQPPVGHANRCIFLVGMSLLLHQCTA